MSEPTPQHSTDVRDVGRIPLTQLVARNTFYNLLTQGILVVVAIWSIPLVVRGLSREGFGLLSLVWAFVGYFALLDFGMSRANTKFLAEALARNNLDEIRKIIWTSLSATFIVGLASGGIIIAATPILVDRVFTVGIDLRTEAVRSFTIASIGIPFMLIFGTLKGFQMALQRFDLMNIFQGTVGIGQWVGSVLLLRLGYGLEQVVLLTVGLRVILSLIALVIMPWLVPGIFTNVPLGDYRTLRKLFSFGGWVTISQVISPLFLYLDRVLIGAFLPLAAVAYYAVPQEALTRFLVVPISLTATLFPALSEQSILGREESKAGTLYDRSVKYLVIVMMPLVVATLLFAPEIVALWLGKDFAEHSVLVFQILAIGLLFNSVAQIPTTVLHAFGRPDLTAKFHLIELPFMVILNVVLIPWIGIVGAAITWCLRVILDAALLFPAARRSVAAFREVHRDSYRIKPAVHYIVLLVSVAGILVMPTSTMKFAAAVVFGILYVTSTWFYGFDEVDRGFFLQLCGRMFG